MIWHWKIHWNLCDPTLQKNSRKIRKICTTPQFELILYYGLEHVCTKFGENPSYQSWVIVPRSVFDLFDLCDLDLWPWVTKHSWGHFFSYNLSCGKVSNPNSHGKDMKRASLTDGWMDDGRMDANASCKTRLLLCRRLKNKVCMEGLVRLYRGVW